MTDTASGKREPGRLQLGGIGNVGGGAAGVCSVNSPFLRDSPIKDFFRYN